MLTLRQALNHWGKNDFSRVLKDELQALGPAKLPLDKATSQGGYVDDQPVSVTVNRFTESDTSIEGSVGIFFTEIVINCGCGDDPMPINGFCEFHVTIDKQTAASSLEAIPG